MAVTEGTGETQDQNVREVLEVANALGERLVELGGDEQLRIDELLQELADAQQELQTAWDLALPQYGDVANIIDNQRADHWWQRKLIATLPMAVVETESDGRIIWANSAAASALDRPVLRLLRAKIQKFIHAEDQQVAEGLLKSFAGVEVDEVSRIEAVLRLEPALGGTMTVELVPTTRQERDGERAVITWVLQPVQEGGGVHESLIAHTFSQLCMLPLRSGSLQDVLADAARLCEDVCASRSSVSMTIGPPAEPEHLASSTEFAQRVDAAQMTAEEGPCQEAWEVGAIVYSNRVLEDSRWPRFCRIASDTGIASALAAPIRVGDEVLGILNVYSRDVDAFGTSGMKVIELLAEATGAIIHHVDEEQQLRELTAQLEKAMESRQIIEQAKGALMALCLLTRKYYLGL